MSSITIKFIKDKKVISIDDYSKAQNHLFKFIAVTQLFSSGIQINIYWLQFDEPFLYLFLLIFLIFSIACIYYFFYDSVEKLINIESISYYSEKPFLWSKIRFLKLKNNKIRLLNFRRKSKAQESLLNYLKKYHITIKS
jgi:hypothetical protein